MNIKKVINKLKVKPLKKVSPVYIPMLQGDYLINKNILITGGAGGIGRAIAYACLNNGATVILCGRNSASLEYTKIEFLANNSEFNGRVYTAQLDISNLNSNKDAIQRIINSCGLDSIDCLVNNAGLQMGGSFLNTNIDDFNNVIETNLRGTYFLSQDFSNYLINNNKIGNILNISSVSGIRPAISPYMISKWGITGLTKGMAKRLIRYGIVVNGIAPGPVATQMLKKDGNNLYYDGSPAKRFIDVNEVANWSVLLLSDMGRMIVGETLYITGGCGTLTLDDIEY